MAEHVYHGNNSLKQHGTMTQSNAILYCGIPASCFVSNKADCDIAIVVRESTNIPRQHCEIRQSPLGCEHWFDDSEIMTVRIRTVLRYVRSITKSSSIPPRLVCWCNRYYKL